MTTHASPQAPQPPSRRGGSNKRQRAHGAVLVRLLPDERNRVEEKARDAGLSLAAFMRASSLGTPGPRARRSPPIDAEAMGRATAALNKAGSNVNQIAHVANAGNLHRVAQESFAALAEVRAAAAAIRAIATERERR